ncbi:PaaI family thioesterase [Streptomyces sp. NPDC055815]
MTAPPHAQTGTTTDTTEQTRTYTWYDPGPALDTAQDLSGMEFLRTLRRHGRTAPMNTTVGIALLTVEPGEVTLTFQPLDWHNNIIGIVHGGMICTLADTAMAMAVLSRLPAGLFPTTTDNQTRFYRPVTADTGTVRCLGTVQHLGRRTAAVRAEVRDTQGRLVAEATTAIVPRPGADDSVPPPHIAARAGGRVPQSLSDQSHHDTAPESAAIAPAMAARWGSLPDQYSRR